MGTLALKLKQKLFYDSDHQVIDLETIRHHIADFLHKEVICNGKLEKNDNRLQFTVANRIVAAIDRSKLTEVQRKIRECKTEEERDAASNLQIELIAEAQKKVTEDIKSEFNTWTILLNSLVVK